MTATRQVRPRGRKDQIVAAAAEQFRTAGYHNVGINDIADALGLTGPALYRHFRGKQQLLEATVESTVEHFVAVYEAGHDSLDALLEDLAAISLQHRHAGILWQREAAHLPADRRQALSGRFRKTVRPLADLIAADRPDLADADVEMLVWACQSVLASVGYHTVKLDSARYRALLVEAALAVCRTPALPVPLSTHGPTAHLPSRTLLPASRREAAIVAAARLFAERGYQAVSMDDIGAAAGITGPSLYHHFPSKSAILLVQLTRCLDSMMFDVSAALDSARTEREAVDLLLRATVRVNVEHGVVMASLINEMVNVPTEERLALRRVQKDYSDEWVALLVAARPELADAEAQVLVQATHSLVGLLARRPRFLQRAGFAAELQVLGRAVLGLPVDP